MPDIAISLADELRFLALQCAAQVRSNHRDQDRAFIDNLIARIFEVAPNLSIILARFLIPAADLHGANLPGLISLAGRDLERLAEDLDRHVEGRAA